MIGILFVNIGSPNSLNKFEIKKFLSSMLLDKRIVNNQSFIWRYIILPSILKTRVNYVKNKYQRIWLNANSPLLDISNKQKEKLETKLQHQDKYKIFFAMRYSAPDISNVFDEIIKQALTKLLIFPLYPQFSSSTTLSVYDEIFRSLLKYKKIPELHFVNKFYNKSGYIKLLANSIREYWSKHNKAQYLLIAFHSIPVKFIEEGDSYLEECLDLTELLKTELGLGEGNYGICFHSKFGRSAWLEPNIEAFLSHLRSTGIKTIDVIAPSFVSDCLETLYDLNIKAREYFIRIGGTDLRYIPALNDTNGFIEFLINTIEESL